MSISATDPALIADRACGGCVSCCCFFTIAELRKPAGDLCSHSLAGGGCDIYPDRPKACRVFHCSWRSWERVPEDWRPDRAGFVLGGTLAPGRYLAVTADPLRPFAWREPAYLPHLMAGATEAAEIGSQLVVFIEKRVIVLRPDGEEDLGVVSPEEVLISDEFGRIRKILRAEQDLP
jgi:hypothetical protein